MAKLTLAAAPQGTAATPRAAAAEGETLEGGPAATGGTMSESSTSQAALSAWREVLGLPKHMPEAFIQSPPSMIPPRPAAAGAAAVPPPARLLQARPTKARARPVANVNSSQAGQNPKAAAGSSSNSTNSGDSEAVVSAALTALSTLCLSHDDSAGNSSSSSSSNGNSDSSANKGKGRSKGKGKADVGAMPDRFASRLGPAVGTSASTEKPVAGPVGKGKAEKKSKESNGKGGKGKGKKRGKGKGAGDGNA